MIAAVFSNHRINCFGSDLSDSICTKSSRPERWFDKEPEPRLRPAFQIRHPAVVAAFTYLFRRQVFAFN